MQWVRLFEKIWDAEHIPVYVRPYTIVCCGIRCGLLENLAMARSVDSIKKGTRQPGLAQCFSELFPTPVSLHRAQHNFMRSLVSYSLITYILQVRDRHNGNILIDSFGHCIHIDFGYILGDSPGGNLGWEKAPFKLTKEFYDVLGGLGSPLWFEFVELMVQAFGALRAHAEEVLALVQVSIPEEFERKGLRDVLFKRLMISDDEVRMLVHKSVDSAWSVSYDIMQRVQNGII
jgi:phosphatidylinositol 4-kinase